MKQWDIVNDFFYEYSTIQKAVFASVLATIVIAIFSYFSTDSSAAFRNYTLSVAALVGFPFLIWRTQIADKTLRDTERRTENEILTKAVEHLANEQKAIVLSSYHTFSELLLTSDNQEFKNKILSMLHLRLSDISPNFQGIEDFKNTILHKKNFKKEFGKDVKQILSMLFEFQSDKYRKIRNLEFEYTTLRRRKILNYSFFYLFIHNTDLSINYYEKVLFEYCKLDCSNFELSIFIDSKIVSSEFNDIDFSSSLFKWVNFRTTKIYNCDFSLTVLENMFFDGSYLNECNFDSSLLLGCNMSECIIENCSFNDAYYNSTKILIEEIEYQPTVFPAGFDKLKLGIKDISLCKQNFDAGLELKKMNVSFLNNTFRANLLNFMYNKY